MGPFEASEMGPKATAPRSSERDEAFAAVMDRRPRHGVRVQHSYQAWMTESFRDPAFGPAGQFRGRMPRFGAGGVHAVALIRRRDTGSGRHRRSLRSRLCLGRLLLPPPSTSRPARPLQHRRRNAATSAAWARRGRRLKPSGTVAAGAPVRGFNPQPTPSPAEARPRWGCDSAMQFQSAADAVAG